MIQHNPFSVYLNLKERTRLSRVQILVVLCLASSAGPCSSSVVPAAWWKPTDLTPCCALWSRHLWQTQAAVIYAKSSTSIPLNIQGEWVLFERRKCKGGKPVVTISCFSGWITLEKLPLCPHLFTIMGSFWHFTVELIDWFTVTLMWIPTCNTLKDFSSNANFITILITYSLSMTAGCYHTYEWSHSENPLALPCGWILHHDVR